MDRTLKCDYLLESYFVVLYCGAVFFVSNYLSILDLALSGVKELTMNARCIIFAVMTQFKQLQC